VEKPAQLQRSGFSCGKAHCNGLVPVRTLSPNRFSGLEPLLSLVVTHQHPAEPQRQTQRVTLYPAPHPALIALPLLSPVLKTCLPPSRMEKSARSLQIHCECKLQRGFRDRGIGNCQRRQCLHLDQWSLAVAASIDLVTPT